jgi:hypothetical protein
MRHAPAQAPVPANYLKPKVFIAERSIRQFRALRKNFGATRADAKAEFACAKG